MNCALPFARAGRACFSAACVPVVARARQPRREKSKVKSARERVWSQVVTPAKRPMPPYEGAKRGPMSEGLMGEASSWDRGRNSALSDFAFSYRVRSNWQIVARGQFVKADAT